jgi:hypothetical protein
MTCYLHTDLEATAYCRSCGRPLCGACQRIAQGTVYCMEHAPAERAPVASAQPLAPAETVSPGLAFVLGLIPGVGAIYNRQYVKGLIHVIILGVLISILHSEATGGFEPLFGLLVTLWFFYMAFEAYHTAGKRLRGEPVDEFSSLIPSRGPSAGSTAGPVALIVLGVLFLVMTFRPEWAHQIFKLWPVALILAGIYMLMARLKERAGRDAESKESPYEQQ